MDLSDYDYHLPDELIARFPTDRRTGSRLLMVDPTLGRCSDWPFTGLGSLLRPGDLLVLNDTRVIPARLYGRKTTGGAVELLVERLLDRASARVMTRSSKPIRIGQHIAIDGPRPAEVIVCGEQQEFRLVRTAGGGSFMALLEDNGRVPLPPYLERPDTPEDKERYQSVFACEPGAVAAPTASLHFDEQLLNTLRRQGIRLAHLTLHIGAGTFLPLRGRDLDAGRLHSEWTRVPPETVMAIEATSAPARVVAVGTTVCRALESWALAGRAAEFEGETDLFIMPGFSFSVVDALLTNFHLPRSSLLMLVSAFAGAKLTRLAYRHAVRNRYRFYSYGDAMFIQHRGFNGV